MFSWFKNHSDALFNYFRMALLAWIDKHDEAARHAAYDAAITAVGKDRHLMIGYLWFMADSRPDAENAAMRALGDMITAKTDFGSAELMQCRKELFRLDKEYGKAIFPPDPSVFTRRYPDLLSSPIRIFDGDAFWRRLPLPTSTWTELTEVERRQSAEAFLKRECPKQYPDYNPTVFVLFTAAITKEVQTAIAEGYSKSDLSAPAIVALTRLAEAIRTNDLANYLGL